VWILLAGIASLQAISATTTFLQWRIIRRRLRQSAVNGK
jgi:hypothetical protein